MTILSLVQLGFGGFVAALALLSYRLMVQEGKKPKPNRMVYDNIQKYAQYTMLLSLIVILGAVISHVKDLTSAWMQAQEARAGRQTVMLSQQAQDCRETLTGLNGQEGSGRTVEQLELVHKVAYSVCFGVMNTIEALEGRIARGETALVQSVSSSVPKQ